MRTEIVTTLKRKATDLIAELEKEREPILITQHGLPSAYLDDVESFELMQKRLVCFRESLGVNRRSPVGERFPMPKQNVGWHDG
jgi:prevent-host-death family protein